MGWCDAFSPSLTLFLHTSAAGGQGCAEATASQLPNSLSNLLVGFEAEPFAPYRDWIPHRHRRRRQRLDNRYSHTRARAESGWGGVNGNVSITIFPFSRIYEEAQEMNGVERDNC